MQSLFQRLPRALDGIHVLASVPSADRPRYRNRKGETSQNVLAACNFDFMFVYVLSGWEGSASDSQTYQNAVKIDFQIPDGLYYLGSAGFPLCNGCLVPYQGVRHGSRPREGDLANEKPQDYQELFNLRHWSLQNVVARVFAVMKERFAIFKSSPEFNTMTQAKIVQALCAVHNFIRIHDPADFRGLGSEDDMFSTEESAADEIQVVEKASTDAEETRASRRRDEIAKAMWVDYQQELAHPSPNRH